MPPRPSSSHSQVPNQTATSNSSNLGLSNQQQQQQAQPPLDTSLGSPGRPPSANNPSAVPPNSIPPLPNSNMAAQGSYQAPPPHMHGGYKPGPQGLSPYPPSQQYSQPNYSPRAPYPGQYGPQGGQPPPPNSMQPGQYPGRPMPNHVPHSQYPPYQQAAWGPPQGPPQNPAMMQNHIQGGPGSAGGGKGVPPQPGGPGAGSPRKINYLKQHLQVVVYRDHSNVFC